MGRLDRFRGLRLRGGVREYVLEWTFRISLLLCSVGVVPTCRRSALFGLISFVLIMSRESRCAGGVPTYTCARVLVAREGARTGGRRVGEARGASACVVRIYDSRERFEGI